MVWDSTMAGLELDNNLFSDLVWVFCNLQIPTTH